MADINKIIDIHKKTFLYCRTSLFKNLFLKFLINFLRGEESDRNRLVAIFMLCFDVCVSILHCVVIYVDLGRFKRLMTWMDSYSRQNLLPLINVIYTLYMLFKYLF